MKLTHILVPALLLSMFAACDEERRKKKDDDPPSACSARCECQMCDDAQREECQSLEAALFQQAEEASCESEAEVYIECQAAEGTCLNGTYTASSCEDEHAAYTLCAGGNPCPTTNNSVCDEPGTGNGSCPAGSDAVDCGAATCATTNDDLCDEPEGTDTCPDGTDVADCNGEMCPTKNDGTCDEPQGTNTCPEGSDAADCGGPATCDAVGTCGDYSTGCVGCAVSGPCAQQFSVCESSPACVGYSNCLSACADPACYDMCETQHATGATEYSDLVSCVICQECSASCNGAQTGC